jgi:Raf kinase inhibitor-like YbhB/YbcL family protein
MTRLKYIIPLIIVSLTSCSGCGDTNIEATKSGLIVDVFPLHLTSTAFKSGDTIPTLYTCDSTDISPELHWDSRPTNTASFALIMDDPDAPMGTWVHWIVYNIPDTVTEFPMHFPKDSVLANGTKQGYTSFRMTGYGGPCPPDREHRYYFKLYALDIKLNIPAMLNKPQLLNAMKGHVLAEADLMGRYTKKKK